MARWLRSLTVLTKNLASMDGGSQPDVTPPLGNPPTSTGTHVTYIETHTYT